MKINIDTYEMQQYSGDLQNIIFDLEKNMQRIEGIVLTLQSDWQGDSERIYSNKILVLKKQFSYLLEFVKNQSSLMKDISTDFEQTELNIKNKMEG